MVSLGGSATLNPKTSNPKPNSNVLPKPWELDSDFHLKTHPIIFIWGFYFFCWVFFGGSAGDINIILLLGLGAWLSHVGNLEPINHITPTGSALPLLWCPNCTGSLQNMCQFPFVGITRELRWCMYLYREGKAWGNGLYQTSKGPNSGKAHHIQGFYDAYWCVRPTLLKTKDLIQFFSFWYSAGITRKKKHKT